LEALIIVAADTARLAVEQREAAAAPSVTCLGVAAAKRSNGASSEDQGALEAGDGAAKSS